MAEQEKYEWRKQTEQHGWLKQLVGEWAVTMPMPDGSEGAATERVRSLGDIWVQAEMEAKMPDGQPAMMQLTLGFDPHRKSFVGTWVGSMMNHLWVYNGQLDAAGKVLTLNAEGPDMDGSGRMAKYHDIITIVGPNERTLTSEQQQADGSWKQFMKSTYKRKT